MKILKNCKRLGILIFFDAEGIVDDYVTYLLNDFKSCCQDIVIICNGDVNPKGLEKLCKYTKKIIKRENTGLDAGALKEYFESTKEYLNYDEVVIMNDTFFGPFYSFNKIFDTMNLKDIDFWGLTLGHSQPDGYGIFNDGIPEHIQTFFLALRNTVLKSKSFQDYWQNYDISQKDTFMKVVTGHELIFTKYLKDAGFVYDSYVKDDNVSANYWQNYNNYAYNTKTQIIKDKAPFIKRKTVVSQRDEIIYLTDKADLKESLDYVKNNTDYDMDLIWQNILRRYPLNDIMKSIGKFKIILSNEKNYKDCCNIIFINDKFSLSKIKDLLSKNFKVLFYTTYEEIYESLNKITKNVTLLNTSFIEQLAKDVKKAKEDYIRFIYLPENDKITLISETICENYVENILGNGTTEYFNGLTKLFEEDENLGIVYAPNNYHFDYFFKNLIWTKEEVDFFSDRVPDFLKKNNYLPFVKTNAWMIKASDLKKVEFSMFKNLDDDFSVNVLSLYLSYYLANNNKYSEIGLNINNAENRLNDLEDIYEKTYRILYDNGLNRYTYVEATKYLKKKKSIKERVKGYIKWKMRYFK